MALTTKVDLKKEYLEVRIEGVFDLPSAYLVNDAILGSVEKYQVLKVLVDFRKMTGHLDSMERFHYAENFAKKYMELVQAGRVKPPRLAFLGRVPQLDPNRFGETVAVNRGVPLRSMDNPQEAWDWLEVQPEAGVENKPV